MLKKISRKTKIIILTILGLLIVTIFFSCITYSTWETIRLTESNIGFTELYKNLPQVKATGEGEYYDVQITRWKEFLVIEKQKLRNPLLVMGLIDIVIVGLGIYSLSKKEKKKHS